MTNQKESKLNTYKQSSVDYAFPKGKPPKKNYVYIHRDNNNEIFYVGSGKKRRGWCCNLRSPEWKVRAFGGFTLEILQHDMTKKDATILEYNTINILLKNNTKLVNIFLGKKYGNIKIHEALCL